MMPGAEPEGEAEVFCSGRGDSAALYLCCWHRGTWLSPQDPWAGSSEGRAAR